MANEPKKPRKIKDLKARLGKTISPGTQGSGGSVRPGGIPAPTIPGPGGGSIPAPMIPGAGIPGAGVAPPPFARPKVAKASDPFAASEQAAAQEVRLVIDDKPVAESEVGRRKRGLALIMLGVGILLGFILGGGAGTMMSDRRQYNYAVQDGKAIYDMVIQASETVEQAERHITESVRLARGGPGKTPAVAYEEIQALQALKKPIDTEGFARRRYQAMPQAVDTLFEYANNVQTLWDQFETLAARALPAERRRALDASAAATEAMRTPVGCLLQQSEETGHTCALVYMEMLDEPDADGNNVLVRSRLRGSSFPKLIYTGQEIAEAEHIDAWVLALDMEHSTGPLGEGANEFALYVRDISEVKDRADKTRESQGQLINLMGSVATLEPVFACHLVAGPTRSPPWLVPALAATGLLVLRRVGRRRRVPRRT